MYVLAGSRLWILGKTLDDLARYVWKALEQVLQHIGLGPYFWYGHTLLLSKNTGVRLRLGRAGLGASRATVIPRAGTR
ncbi:MAG: hypothetical protein LC797_17550 [Chloroflexi bacterium]|nr:hypothetical protein [Chloroflexota bacterium]